VGSVLAAAEEAVEKRYSLRMRGYDLEKVALGVSEVLGAEPAAVWKKGRYRDAVTQRPLNMGVDRLLGQGYTFSMKTAISLPNDVFEKAEQLARKAGKSRSQIYCEALREYVARHSPDEVTELLNRAMEQLGQTEDRFVTLASARTLARVEW
jgi:hypothetical protein